MGKKCPNCGKELPEEAAFCLFCFTDIDNYKKSEICPVAVTATENSVSKLSFSSALKKKLNKKIFCRIGIAAAFLLIMGICIFSMKSINSSDTLKAETGTTIIKETSTVAVTDKGGEAVTDEAGEQVFEVVEVTKIAPVSTTEKQGFFDKIFNISTTKKNKTNNKTDKNKNDSLNSTETTKKESFFDKIFNKTDKEEKKTTLPSSTNTSKPPKTTSNPTITTLPSSTNSPIIPDTEEHGTTQIPSTSEKIPTTNSTTTKPVQTETKTSEVYTTDNGSYHFEYEPQYSSSPDGNIALTKYIGEATVVTIPSYIDGRKVAVIKENCFSDDSKIKEIHFDDSSTYTVMLYRHCFNNLSSLSKIVTNDKGYFTSTAFAYNCPIVYIGKGGDSENILVDGAYYLGTTFLWFTAHPSYTTLTFPDWCTKIDNAQNLHECPNLKVINIHKNVANIQKSSIYYGDGLTAINVEAGHPEVFSSDGVLFYKWGNDTIYSCVYPYSKTDKTFKLPDNCYLSMGKGSIYTTNAYLEEVWLPETGYLKSPGSKDFYNNCYPNLKKIYIAKNHSQYDEIASTFKGELIVKDF